MSVKASELRKEISGLEATVDFLEKRLASAEAAVDDYKDSSYAWASRANSWVVLFTIFGREYGYRPSK